MSEYTEGVCGDGVAILKDGLPMKPEEIISELTKLKAECESRMEQDEVDSIVRYRDRMFKEKDETILKQADVISKYLKIKRHLCSACVKSLKDKK